LADLVFVSECYFLVAVAGFVAVETDIIVFSLVSGSIELVVAAIVATVQTVLELAGFE
jgi:hypothetical protein